MKRAIVFLLVLGLAGAAAGAFALRELSRSTAHVHEAKYYCPMHPSYTSDKPGDCPICNMRLVPMPPKHTPEAEKKALAQHGGEGAGPSRAARHIAGYAPVELTAEQREQIGVKTEKIGRRPIRETRRLAGTVMIEKMGMGSSAWVYVPIHPTQRRDVYPNQPAQIEIPVRARKLSGKVDFVDSDATLHTHVIKIRLTVSNPESFLKNEMGANVTLEYPERESVAVPQSGVLHSGERAIAFVDLGGGVFEPRELELGTKSGEYFEVKSGLEEGELVATGGNFLLDSESRIRHAMQGGDEAQGAGHVH